MILAMPSHSHSSCHTIPLEFWLFPSPSSPTSPGTLPDTSPGSVVAPPRRPGWQDWNTSSAEECPHCPTLQKQQSWDYLQNLLGSPVLCSAPLLPCLHGVPNKAESSCFLTPKNGFPNPTDGKPLHTDSFQLQPILFSACAPPPLWCPSHSHAESVYSSGRGWLTRRQFHLTVSGSFLGVFSTLMDKLLLRVLSACYKSPCSAQLTRFDSLGCASLSPELHLHEPETGPLNLG